jgi:RNA polymerase sigma-70 factor (ECF subfamily)
MLARAQSGDRQAMDVILQEQEQRIYRFGLRVCHHEADAREVLQETLLAMYRNLSSFRGDAQLSSWLFQIARTFCIKQHRRRDGEPAAFEDVDSARMAQLPSEESGAEARAHAREVGAIIGTALEALNADSREAIVLHDLEGLTAKEAAAVLGIHTGAFKSRLHRARLSLKEALGSLDASNPNPACRGAQPGASPTAA